MESKRDEIMISLDTKSAEAAKQVAGSDGAMTKPPTTAPTPETTASDSEKTISTSEDVFDASFEEILGFGESESEKPFEPDPAEDDVKSSTIDELDLEDEIKNLLAS